MVAAMAMVTNSVEARQRGAFMSVNSSMQHLAGGFGTALGGMIVQGGAGQPFLHFEKVGYLAAGTSILGIWLAGRLRSLDGPQVPATISQSIAAAAEAQADAGEVLASLEANEPNPLDRDERAG
jgi:MFS family permease